MLGELIEQIPLQDRKQWLDENLESLLENFQAVFNDLAIASSVAAEVAAEGDCPVRNTSQSLLFLDCAITDLMELKWETSKYDQFKKPK